MPEISSCPHCKRPVSVPERLIGRTVRCPSCKSTYTARSIIGEAEAVEEPTDTKRAEDADDRQRQAIVDEAEETEGEGYERPRFRDIHVHGWGHVQTGLILLLAGFGVALISTLILTLSSQSDASTVVRAPLVQGGRGDELVKDETAALVCMFSGGALDDVSARTSLWITSLAGIGLAAILSAVGYGFCMQVPRDHRARSTVLGALLLTVMGYSVFLGGCIWSYGEFEEIRAMSSGSKAAPTSYGMVAGILGFTLLLSQPLVIMFFLRRAAVTGRADYFASSISYGIAVVVFGLVAYITAVIGLFWMLQDFFDSLTGSRLGGGVEIIGMVGSISAIVAFFTWLAVALWYIVALLLTRRVINQHVDKIR
jgi:hypothetical protein